jgi:hypothetical protein
MSDQPKDNLIEPTYDNGAETGAIDPIELTYDDGAETGAIDPIEPTYDDGAADPPITELDIRMIAASLYDQGRGHVLADMIEAVRGEEVRRLEARRPPHTIFASLSSAAKPE